MMLDDFIQSSYQPSSSRNPHAFGAGPTADAADQWATSPNARTAAPLYHPFDGGYENDAAHQHAAALAPNDAAYLTTNTLLDPVAALETGFISSDLDPSTAATPIFQLGRVQYAFNAPLALMTVSSNILTMCLFAYPSSSNGAAPSNPFPTAPPRLVRINLDDPERTEEADVPIPPAPRANRNQPSHDPTTVGPHKMFADPSGRHLILTMRNGDCYYWTSGWKKARILNKLKGIAVESVAWNKLADPAHPSSSANAQRGRRAGGGGGAAVASTREILVGTRSGDIYEVVIVAPVAADADEGDFFDKLARRTAGGGGDRGDIDKAVRHIFTLPERQPVTGLTAEPFPRSMQPVAAVAAGNDATRRRAAATPKAVVIATTSTRIYEFVGHLGKLRGDESESESLYEKLFEPYRGDAVPNLKSELPGDLPYSELHTWTASGHREASALAWLTGPGVYHGLVSYSDQDVGDSVIDSANLLPYPAVALEGSGDGGDGSGGQTIAEIPLSIALTEFHFILLYQDRVMAISSLDDQVIFEEPLPLRPEERVIGTAVDAAKRTFWVYTDASIFELVVKDEDRDVWRIYLERGSFDASLRYAKPGIQRGTVLSSQGDRYFSEARYIQAAQCYAQTFMRSFEEIVLRFIEAGQRDALRYYLVMRLERLRRSDVPQRTMLATWLVEIYLSKINQLEDVAAAEAASQDVENYKLEREMLSEELEQFLATYQDVLDPRTTYALIQKHGRAEVLLHYARTIGDYDKIVRHYVQEEAWSRAIDTLNRQESEDLYYRFATVLMRNAPGELVECWMRRKSLEPRRLIPALLQHRPRRGERDQAIRYLRHVVSRDGNTDTAIHNLLLTLLARAAASAFAHSDDSAKAELVAFIDSAPCKPLSEQPYFDLDYALRTCAAHGQKEACVRIYVKMGRYESAVELALQQGEMELACSSAERFEGDREAKKKLWLKITREVVRNTRDIKSAMDFLARTPLIGIEDALPFFPDFVVIDDCKASICSALEGYASHIETLKDEMEEASRCADAISKDINELSTRFVSLSAGERCARCGKEVRERMFYTWSCRHAMHGDCLVEEVKRSMQGGRLRRLVEVQGRLRATNTNNAVAAAGGGGGGGLGGLGGGGLNLVGTAGTRTLALEKLRDMVSPEAIMGAISTGVSVSVQGGRRALAPLDPFSNPVQSQWIAGPARPERIAAAAAAAGAGMGKLGTGKVGGGATMREDQEEQEKIRQELDELIAAECPVCCRAVGEVGRAFVRRGEDEGWAI